MRSLRWFRGTHLDYSGREMFELTALCDQNDCRRIKSHEGEHNSRPDEAWGFLAKRDRDKIGKAGYATPRGGDKGAYQNHVYRNSRVIIPYEKLNEVDLSVYVDGYIIRLFPNQYFDSSGVVKGEFLQTGALIVGKDAFLLYRSYESLDMYPPLADWSVRALVRDGKVVSQRGHGAVDTGHYVLRLSNSGKGKAARNEGPAQGIFAPEYADAELNYLSKTMLVWLIVHARRSPYTSVEALHVRAILERENILRTEKHEFLGVTRNGLTSCPLCLRIIDYGQLHDTVTFTEKVGVSNAGAQVVGATRSTEVNLFHLVPLVYATLHHAPMSIGWGHAICNTLLGQRRCYSVAEMQRMDRKVAVVQDDEVITFGWMSEDHQMIRSSQGAVWVMLSDNMNEAERLGTAIAHPTPPGADEVDDSITGTGPTTKDTDQ